MSQAEGVEVTPAEEQQAAEERARRRRRPREDQAPTPEEPTPGEIARIVAAPVVDEPETGEVDSYLAARILATGTPEEALTPRVRVRARDLVGRPLALISFHLIETRTPEGEAIYGLMEMVDMDTGEELIVTTGARHMLAQLHALDRQGVLPLPVTIEHSQRDIDPGGFRIWLRAAPPPPD